MVRASGQEKSTFAGSIVGGFVLVPVAPLIVAWRSVEVADFRAWLACWEIRARRLCLDDDRAPAYNTPELAKLLGISLRRSRASVRRLVDAGLLEWSLSGIEFPGQTLGIDEGIGDTIGGGRGSLAIPRRVLRFLANGARPALIATALGILLRCLSRRSGGFNGRGRVKASWIAKVFEVDERRVKAARRELVERGWINIEIEDRQSAMNRWGRACRINLEWSPAGGRSLPPLDRVERREIATPSVNQDPFQEKIQHQEPASGRPEQTGDWLGKQGAEIPSPPAILRGPALPASSLPPPVLADVRVEDLRDVSRTLELHEQAATQGLVGRSEADRLKFVGLAEHAHHVGRANPPGLFSALLRRGAWAFITQGEEDAARRKLRAFERQGQVDQTRPGSLSFEGRPSVRASTFVPDDQGLEARRAAMLRQLSSRVRC